MAHEAKIIGKTEDGNFIIDLKDKDSDANPVLEILTVAHDYVMIQGLCSLQIDMSKTDVKSEYGIRNWVRAEGSIQIGIREFQEIILPYLNNHKYLQPEHISNRTYTEDDKYYKDYNLDKPRYLKGDEYPAYAYNACSIRWYDESTKTYMVTFRRVGSNVNETVTLELFEQIKPSLNLIYDKWALEKLNKNKG